MTPFQRGRSLVWPLTGAFLIAVVIGAILQGLAVLAVVRPMEARDAKDRAEVAVSLVAGALDDEPTLPTGTEIDSLLARLHLYRTIRPSILFVLMDDGTLAATPPGYARLATRVLGDTSESNPRERNQILARQALVHDGRGVGQVLVLRRPTPGSPSGGAPFAVLFYFPLATALSAALGLLLVRLLAGRLRALEQLAGRIAEGDLSARVTDPHQDEIGRVAGQLDRMAERLAAARDQLAANDLQRRQLFADITHELATPLTSIRAAAETLLNPQVKMSEEERTRYLRGVLEESHRLDRLIRDLLELARLEAGATPLDRERIDWAALCRNTIERFAPRYAGAQLTLEWRGAGGDAWIEADGLRLEQVLDNLLVNALRYVPAGGRVALALDRPGGPPWRWRLTVSDDGPGLPEAELPLVFERFYRGSATRGTQDGAEPGGSGLGLAIVREIIERHGGAVRARAATPHGLAIEVELPALG
jgi:signal transduction histidine kinase